MAFAFASASSPKILEDIPRSGWDDHHQLISKAIFTHRPTSYQTALSIIEEIVRGCSGRFAHTVDLLRPVDAVGRICKTEVRSSQATPPCDTSAMDGFAVSSKITQTASQSSPIFLRPRGTMGAGHTPIAMPAGLEGNGEIPCVEIMTGSSFPISTSKSPFDACIRIEDTAIVQDPADVLHPLRMIVKPVLPNQNRRFAGTDFRRNDLVIAPGVAITPQHLMATESLGIREIAVYPKLRVAVISTGTELVSGIERTNDPHHIRDSNGPYLQACLSHLGVAAHCFGPVGDDLEAFKRVVRSILDEKVAFDAVITTGAVSVGKFDFVRRALEKLEAALLFHGISIRPGHPVLVATVSRSPPEITSDRTSLRPSHSSIPFFCLPGNPMATAACFRFLVIPYLRLLHGQRDEAAIPAKLGNTMFSTPTKACSSDADDSKNFRTLSKPSHLRVFWHGTLDPAKSQVVIHDDQDSSKIRQFASGNCWAVVPEGIGIVEHGAWFDCFPMLPASLGSH